MGASLARLGPFRRATSRPRVVGLLLGSAGYNPLYVVLARALTATIGAQLVQVELNEFRLPGRLGQVEAGEAYRQSEAARAGAAWIDVEDAVAPVRVGFVGVAGDDDLNAGGVGVEVKVFEIVQGVNGGQSEVHDRRLRKDFTPGLGIHIAADRVDRRDGLQLFENERVADIAGVDDRVRTV